MSDNSKKKYLWVVEWDSEYTQPDKSGMYFYSITLLPDVEQEDFEKFMKEEAFPAIEGISNRTATHYGPHYLLEDAGEEKDLLDTYHSQIGEVVKRLESLADRTLYKKVSL